MKLVKATNSDKYAEDFGLSDGTKIYLYDSSMECAWNGDKYTPVSHRRLSTSPVVRVNALWVEKNIKVACGIADTQEKKIQGLQGTEDLPCNQGLYFPYLPYSDINIHQGSVPYELDLIFIQDDIVAKIQENTKVGSKDTWSCSNCTGLLEVKGGFCAANNVRVGDRVALFAVSEKDIVEVDEENKLIASGAYTPSSEGLNRSSGSNNRALIHLVSAIADSL